MSRFPTAGHLVSWAKLCPRTIQSGAKSTSGKTGKGNRYLRAVLGDAAAGAEIAAARSACCWPTSDAVHRWTWRPAIARSVQTERSVQPPCAGPEVSAQFVDPRADPRTGRYSGMALLSDSSADRFAAPTFSSTSGSSPHLSVDRSSSARGGARPDVDDTADRPPPSTCTRPIRSLRQSALREGRTVAYLHGPPHQSSASYGHVFAPDLWRSLSSVGEAATACWARLETGAMRCRYAFAIDPRWGS